MEIIIYIFTKLLRCLAVRSEADIVSIYEHCFTLETLNSKLENVELSNVESRSRPTTISQKTLNSGGNSLKQNGLYLCLINFIL